MPILAFSVSEAADLAGVPRTVLDGLILIGQGPKARRVGSRNIILRADLEKWLKALPEDKDYARMDELRCADGTLYRGRHPAPEAQNA